MKKLITVLALLGMFLGIQAFAGEGCPSCPAKDKEAKKCSEAGKQCDKPCDKEKKSCDKPA